MRYIATLSKKILTYAFVIFGFGYMSAQDTTEEETPSIEAILQSIDGITTNFETRAHPSGNSSDLAYIYQIGSDNIGSVRVSANNSELNLMQHGNYNRADIKVSAKTVGHKTLQNGNGNLLMEYGNSPHLDLHRDILQDGDNQNLIIYGSNSLTKNLKLHVQGNAETITIRNFN